MIYYRFVACQSRSQRRSSLLQISDPNNNYILYILYTIYYITTRFHFFALALPFLSKEFKGAYLSESACTLYCNWSMWSAHMNHTLIRPIIDSMNYLEKCQQGHGGTRVQNCLQKMWQFMPYIKVLLVNIPTGNKTSGWGRREGRVGLYLKSLWFLSDHTSPGLPWRHARHVNIPALGSADDAIFIAIVVVWRCHAATGWSYKL